MEPGAPIRQSTFLRLYPFLHLGMRGLLRILAPRWSVSGRHHIPRRGPVIFTPNHISDGDPPFIFASTRYPLWYMGKSDLWEIKWLAPILDFAQTFPVDQGSPDRTALKFSLDLLKRGHGLVVFPEGHISETGELDEILPGAVLIALKAGVPVIPVGLSGIQHVIPYGSTIPKFTLKPVHIHFAAPLDFSDLAGLPSRAGREAATERLAESIRHAREVADRRARTK